MCCKGTLRDFCAVGRATFLCQKAGANQSGFLFPRYRVGTANQKKRRGNEKKRESDLPR
jgi:hypothetical protein